MNFLTLPCAWPNPLYVILILQITKQVIEGKCAAVRIKIGEETYTGTGSNAKHVAFLKVLNETRYRYTNIPGALRSIVSDKNIHTQDPDMQCKKEHNVQSLLDLKLEPLSMQQQPRLQGTKVWKCPNEYFQCNLGLRLPHRNDAKIAKICNLWTFWLVIQLINHLFKIRQKAFLPNDPQM